MVIEREVLKINEPEIKGTEICFVTSTDNSAGTFFAQFCKYTNEDLCSFNKSVGEYCENVKAARDSADQTPEIAESIHAGDILCAKYPVDEQWYRALVLNSNEQAKSCTVTYIDYGNVETVTFDNLVRADEAKLPAIKRAPFGVNCILNSGSKNYEAGDIHLALCSLFQNYVMIKVLERQSDSCWRVEIPQHAYNVPYWLTFKPESLTDTSRERKIEASA